MQFLLGRKVFISPTLSPCLHISYFFEIGHGKVFRDGIIYYDKQRRYDIHEICFGIFLSSFKCVYFCINLDFVVVVG